ncbi:MAG: Calx-beta domain-containing protein [Pseudomonadota bacterium]
MSRAQIVYYLKFLLVLLVTVLMGAGAGGSSVLAANLDVPGDFSTIQAAVDASVDGDVVIVAPGTYTENIDFLGKAIAVRSAQPNNPAIADATVIDGGGVGAAVTFKGGEGVSSVLNGLTIENGNDGCGGGISCQQSSPSIMNCRIRQNRGQHGGGIGCLSGAAPVIVNCLIYSNEADLTGGGIYADADSCPVITNCVIADNDTSLFGGGGLYCVEAIVTNCIVWGNYPNGLFASEDAVMFSDIQESKGGSGNISADPVFVNAAAGDYHVAEDSPCIDAGSNEAPGLPATDKDGNPRILNVVVDMGAFEAPEPEIDPDVITVTIQAGDPEAAEPDKGPVNTGKFTVVREGNINSELIVKYKVTGTATAGADYTQLSGTVTIPAKKTEADIIVTPLQDQDYEGDETVVVTLTTSVSYTIGSPGNAEVVIKDNDRPTITIQTTDAEAAEPGNGPVNTGKFTLTRTGKTDAEFAVTIKVAGTAINGTDYSEVADTVTFPAKKADAVIIITPSQDTDFEGDETVVVSLVSNPSYIIGSPSSGTVTIKDNDRPDVSIVATDSDAAEPSKGPVNTGRFTVSRTGITSSELVVTYKVSGTAAAGTDYAELAGSVTIPAKKAEATITVTPLHDADFEGDETVVVTLTSSVSYTIASPSTDTVTIKDNDLAVVTLAATDADAAEPGTGPVNTGKFTVYRTGNTTSDLSVTYKVAGTATAGTDYTELTGSVTIPAKKTEAVFTVTPLHDVDSEANETVVATLTVSAAYAIGAPSSGMVVIKDNDLPVVTVKATDPEAAEPFRGPVNTGKFTVYRTGITATAVTVTYKVAGTATAGTDYAELVGSVVIPPRKTDAIIVVTPLNDLDCEGNETVVLTLTVAEGYTVGTPSSDTVTIIDNDIPTVTVAATDPEASEPRVGPLNTGKFTVTRNTTGPAMTVNYTVAGSAAAGADYTELAGSVTIPAGKSEISVTVSPLADTEVEGDETVILNLSAGGGYVVGKPGSATVVIKDEDMPSKPVITVKATDPDAAEPFRGPVNTGKFTVYRAGDAAAELTVTYKVTGTATGGTDYTELTGSVTIPAKKTEALVTITPLHDLDFEGDETVVITLSAGVGYTVGVPASDTVVIKDDDLPAVTVVATDPDAAEPSHGPVNTGKFTVYRTGNTSAELIVSYKVAGTAGAGTDYTALTGTVTIPAKKAEAVITVTPLHDLDFEGPESVIVTLAVGAGYVVGKPNSDIVVINDNDLPAVSVTATDPAAAEPFRGPVDTGRFTITRTGNVSLPLIVQYKVTGTATAGTDYAQPSGSVTIPARQTSAQVVITPLNDTEPEKDETVILEILPDQAYAIGTPKNATVTIMDND